MFSCLLKIFLVFMNLAVKMYKKRYDGHSKNTFGNRLLELCALIYLNLVHPEIKFHFLYWTKVVTYSNFTHLLEGKQKENPGSISLTLPFCDYR